MRIECSDRLKLGRQKLNWNRENVVLYSINLDVFSIAIKFLTTNDLDSVVGQIPCEHGQVHWAVIIICGCRPSFDPMANFVVSRRPLTSLRDSHFNIFLHDALKDQLIKIRTV